MKKILAISILLVMMFLLASCSGSLSFGDLSLEWGNYENKEDDVVESKENNGKNNGSVSVEDEPEVRIDFSDPIKVAEVYFECVKNKDMKTAEELLCDYMAFVVVNEDSGYASVAEYIEDDFVGEAIGEFYAACSDYFGDSENTEWTLLSVKKFDCEADYCEDIKEGYDYYRKEYGAKLPSLEDCCYLVCEIEFRCGEETVVEKIDDLTLVKEDGKWKMMNGIR